MVKATHLRPPIVCKTLKSRVFYQLITFKPVLGLYLILGLILGFFFAIFSLEPIHSQESHQIESQQIKFISNSYKSLFGRAPKTTEFDYWLQFFDKGGEKLQLLQKLKNTNEYFQKYRPTGAAGKLSINILAKPSPKALRLKSIMPGDRFQVVGKHKAYYRIICGETFGWVLQEDIEITHASQKIDTDTPKIRNADITAKLAENFEKLQEIRNKLLNLLLIDGKSYLFQFIPGNAIKGEQIQEEYQDVLRQFIVNMKVAVSESPFDFRGVLLELRDDDLVKYDILRKLDEIQNLGVNSLVIRYFYRGNSLEVDPNYNPVLQLPFTTILERYQEEAQKRGFSLYLYCTSFSLGRKFARIANDLLAVNGLGFTADHYEKGNFFFDFNLKKTQDEFFRILAKGLNLTNVNGVFLDDFFYPLTPGLQRDIRAFFTFNQETVRLFEGDTGLAINAMGEQQENIFRGWLKNIHRTLFIEIKKRLNRRGWKLSLMLPERSLDDTPNTITNHRDFPSDFLVVNHTHLDKIAKETSGKIIIYFGKESEFNNRQKLDEETSRLQKQNPRITGWLTVLP